MNKIPIRKIQEDSFGIVLSYLEGEGADDIAASIDVHRDNYYAFFIKEKGECTFVIDFKEYKSEGKGIICILPGQVHFGSVQKKSSGWFLCIEALFVQGELKEAFDKLLFCGNLVTPDAESFEDLKSCLRLLFRKINSDTQELNRYIIHALATSVLGLIAEMYQNKQANPSNKRLETITYQFKSLLSANLVAKKKPSQYAEMLHISPSYLNEAVKKTTGFTAGYWIQHEIMLEAKRLLFYTTLNIKEIACKLGYEDWAYFTRIFTKEAGVSPLLFRKNYLK